MKPRWWADRQRDNERDIQHDNQARRAHVRPPWLAALGMGLIASIELSLVWQGQANAVTASIATASIAGLGGFVVGIQRGK